MSSPPDDALNELNIDSNNLNSNTNKKEILEVISEGNNTLLLSLLFDIQANSIHIFFLC